MAMNPNVKPIPDGYHTITPYLMCKGSVRLIEFIKQAFGAKELYRSSRPDGSVMHGSFQIGDSMLWMGEGHDPWKPMPSSLHLYVPDVDAVYQKAFQAGGVSVETPTDQDYGDRESGVRDPSGNLWWIATHKAGGAGQHAPKGFRTLTPYLFVEGTAKLIEFLQRGLGAEEVEVMKSPEGVVGHAQIKIGDSMVELSEARAEWKAMPCAVYLYVTDVDAAYKRAVEAGGKTIMEPANQFYGDRNAGVTDPCGNSWWMGTHIEDVPEKELEKRRIAAGHGV